MADEVVRPWVAGEFFGDRKRSPTAGYAGFPKILGKAGLCYTSTSRRSFGEVRPFRDEPAEVRAALAGAE
jgi:hypothetical protein